MTTHDQESEEFQVKVSAYKLFFKTLSEQELAEFIVHKDASIEGLTRNNETFVEAYHKMLEEHAQALAAARAEGAALVADAEKRTWAAAQDRGVEIIHEMHEAFTDTLACESVSNRIAHMQPRPSEAGAQ